MKKKLYILGKDTYSIGAQWYVIGIFDSFESAFFANTSDQQFIGIMNINETMPNRFQPWPGCKYIHEYDMEKV